MKLNIKFTLFVFFIVVSLFAQENPNPSQEYFIGNNIWMLLSTFLVFIMHLGFSTLEVGLTRSKNTTNILFKNLIIIALGILLYSFWGFNVMYPGENSDPNQTNWLIDGFLGKFVFGLDVPIGSQIGYANGNYTFLTDFLFQAMFAATAMTIVSGAVAERIKLSAFIVFAFLYVGIAYPIIGSWKWGGGWLDTLGFYDFAGSTIVHSFGGWAALVCVIILRPRLGKYINGKVQAIPGHNLPLAAIGVFLLWLGWFGFNGGSVLSADPESISFVLTTTTLAAAAGIIGSAIASVLVIKKPDLTMVLNGVLAGLVSITAGADVISIPMSILVGFIGGVLVVVSVIFIDSILKIDDPVGAISVHLVCGIWGTLAVGLFGVSLNEIAENTISFNSQLIGVLAIGVFSIIVSFIFFFLIKIIMGVRVSEKEERQGLDIAEHGQSAYGEGIEF